jgi:adiponectin receptor
MDLTETSNPAHISRWPVVVMMISAIICLLCSATFHLFYPMAGKYYLVFARLDYAGINILMFGSVVPTFYYGLYCHPYLAELYIICTGTLASFVFVLSLF